MTPTSFLSLPPELHINIGQYLSLRSLARLSCTNRVVSSFYLRSINQRLITLLPLYLAGNYPEHFPRLDCDPNCVDPVCKECFPGLCRALLDHFPDADERTGRCEHPWLILRLWGDIISRISSERVRGILVAAGFWTELWAMVACLKEAVEHCRTENIRDMYWQQNEDYCSDEGIKTVEMLAARVAELVKHCTISDPKAHLKLCSPANAAMVDSRPRCLRILHSYGLCPGPDDHEAQSELLWHGFRYGLSLNGSSYHTLEQKWDVLEFAVRTLGCDLSRPRLDDRGDPEWSFLELFARDANICQDEPEKGNPSEEVYVRILGLFEEAGVTGPALGPTGRGEVPNPGFCYPPIVRAFLRAGFITGPRWCRDYESTYLHRFATFREMDEVELIFELALEHGLRVDAKDEQGETPLCLILSLLARHYGTPAAHLGDDGDYPNFGYYTPEQLEEKTMDMEYGDREKVRYLLKKGADPFVQNTAGFAPITLALHLGWKYLIQDLVELDSRRQERYGELSAQDVWDKWVQNDIPWWRNLLNKGTWLRYELEPQIVQIPQVVKQDEIDYLELEGREDDSPYSFPRGQIVYDP